MHFNLTNKYDIKVLRDYESRGLLRSQKHPSLPLIIWNYTDNCQYERKWDDITIACRGLVTNTVGRVISRPLPKFFNRAEEKHKESESFTAYEKLDGWLGTLFNYRGNWICTTRGSFDNDICNWFNIVLSTHYKGVLENLNIHYTYMFELIQPLTKIVVEYNGLEDVFLLAAVNIEDGSELEINEMVTGFKKAMPVDVQNLDDFAKLKDENREGIVIKFSNGQRYKIKLEEYFRLSSIMNGCTQRNIWRILMEKDNIDSLINNVPDEFRTWVLETIVELKQRYDGLFSTYHSLYSFHMKKANYDKRVLLEDIQAYAAFDKGCIIAFCDHKYNSLEETLWKAMKPGPHLYANVKPIV